MANEITLTSGVKLVNGLLIHDGRKTVKQFDQTTARGGSLTVDVATSEAAIDFGDIVPGFVRITNLDLTNFVRIRVTAATNAIRLRAGGGFAIFEVDPGVTVRAIADTAACKIQIEAFNL